MEQLAFGWDLLVFQWFGHLVVESVWLCIQSLNYFLSFKVLVHLSSHTLVHFMVLEPTRLGGASLCCILVQLECVVSEIFFFVVNNQLDTQDLKSVFYVLNFLVELSSTLCPQFLW